MADREEIREWGRSNGYDVKTRGALPGWLHAAYDAAHNGATATQEPPGDQPGGMTPDGFPAAEAAPDGDGGDTGEVRPEPPPRARPAVTSTAAAGRSLRDRLTGKSRAKTGGRTRKPSKPKHPRIPVDELISGAWSVLARVARPVPPLQRTLRVQAPVAGLLLEDVVRDTAIDRALQPLARGMAGGKVVAALAGPPMLVTAVTLHLQTQAAKGLPPNPLFMAMMTTMLRESLMIWLDVAGPKFEQALAREREFEDRYGQDVDQFISWLFGPPTDPGDAEAVQAEEDAIRRAQGMQPAT